MSNDSKQTRNQAASRSALSVSRHIILPAFESYVEQQAEATGKQSQAGNSKQAEPSENNHEQTQQSEQQSSSPQSFKRGDKENGGA